MRSFVLPILFALVPAVARAQADTTTAADSAAPKAGAEVRVTTRVGRIFYGRLDGVSADSVRIRTVGPHDRTVVTAFPRDSIARFEVNHRGGTHAIVGLLIGAGSGLVMGSVIATSNCVIFCTTQEQQDNNNIVVAGAVAGGVIGLLTGAAIRSSHWHEVSAGHVGVTVRSAGGGLGLGLTLRF